MTSPSRRTPWRADYILGSSSCGRRWARGSISVGRKVQGERSVRSALAFCHRSRDGAGKLGAGDKSKRTV
eukprot:14992857-Ditylum_brightwellii.AAC.2